LFEYKLIVVKVFVQYFFLVVILSSFFSKNIFAQKKKGEEERKSCIEVSQPKAIKLYHQSLDKSKYEKKQRMDFLKQAIEIEPDYVEALSVYAQELIKTAKFEGTSFKSAEKYLLRIVELCPDYDNYAYYYLGQIALGTKKFSDAANHFEKFLKYPDEIKKEEELILAKSLRKKSKELSSIFENPVPFNPVCVEEVSTKDDEYLAIISPDDELMFFTRRMPLTQIVRDEVFQRDSEKLVEKFSMSKRNNEKFEVGEALPPPFNKGDHYGGATVTPDNKHLYVTVCKDTNIGLYNKPYLNCDIFISDFVNGEWTSLRNLGPNINTPDGWESQPSVSSDNKTLYFSSFREGSQGMDIYYSEKQRDGSWGQAKNMGAPINTDKHEKSPFVHSDSHTLYFSSDGHTGAGGFDIFFSKKDSLNNWKEPKNLGHPINTENDEVGFFVSTDGKQGYFASNSLKGKCQGGYDLFSFDLYKEARPREIVFIRGRVDSDKNDLANTTVKIKNSRDNRVAEVDVDSTDGSFVAIVSVEKDDDLIVTIKKEGKAFSAEVLKAKEESIGKKSNVIAEVREIVVGNAYKLNNINYATNSADLTRESLKILDEFIEFLNDNATIKIAIHGHTDDVGKDDFNMALSTDRAFSVLAYLQEKGIPKERLSFKGFGKTKPLVPNTNEKNRAINRRTEFVIVAK
jgi:outer membrane protein OmpA-like peptidoglycan-associated protein/tetratricopeptide (TPR) repeat protein